MKKTPKEPVIGEVNQLFLFSALGKQEADSNEEKHFKGTSLLTL